MARRYRYSFTKKKEAKKGKLSAGLAAASFLLFITAVVLAYLLDDSFGFLVGGVGLFATLLSVYGFIMGLLSFSEEGRSHKTSIIGSISNGLFLIVCYFAEGGAVQAYKQLFNLTSCVESFAALGVDVGTMDDRIPLDRTVLAQEVEAARATRSTQSTADEADKATYTPDYILRHPVDTVLLFVRSAVENGDHYIRTLVGGSLSYYTVDLAWGWVAVLYLLLAYAALPVQGAVMKPAGKARGWCCAAAALCCLLAVAGCLLWTPTHYDTLYGLQGRYFLPVLPLLLLTCLPRRLAAVPDEDTAQTRLVAALALVQAGMVVNIMLAIIAR